MPKEILLYRGIYSYSAENLINQLSAAGDEDVVIRMNTNGGDPQAAFGMIAKMKELKGKTTIKVDGKAISAGFFMLPFADNVQALDVSSFLVHRAAYTSYYEADHMTESEKTDLVHINKGIRAALEQKIDQVKFEAVTGKTFDQVFSMDTRIDVPLTAKQAKEIGLVDEIINLTDSEIAANGRMLFPEDEQIGATKPITKKVITTVNNSKMDKAKLLADHPELFASVLKDGEAKGVKAEKDRTGSWMVWSKVDPEACSKGIASGEPISQTQSQQFMLASANTKEANAMESSAEGAVKTEAQKLADAEASSTSQFEKELDENLKSN